METHHFEGSWSHKYGSNVSGSKKSGRFKTSNRNISKLEKIHNLQEATFKDPKTPNTHAAAKICCGWEEVAICHLSFVSYDMNI
jgi:hypothetical protein